MVDWKLIEYFEDRRIELYDLADDIGESNNLATSNLTKTNELDLRLTATGNSGRNPLRLKPQLRPVRRSQ